MIPSQIWSDQQTNHSVIRDKQGIIKGGDSFLNL